MDPYWMEEAVEAATRAKLTLFGYDKTLDPERLEEIVATDSKHDVALREALLAAEPFIRREAALELAREQEFIASIHSNPNLHDQHKRIASWLRSVSKRKTRPWQER